MARYFDRLAKLSGIGTAGAETTRAAQAPAPAGSDFEQRVENFAVPAAMREGDAPTQATTSGGSRPADPRAMPPRDAGSIAAPSGGESDAPSVANTVPAPSPGKAGGADNAAVTVPTAPKMLFAAADSVSEAPAAQLDQLPRPGSDFRPAADQSERDGIADVFVPSPHPTTRSADDEMRVALPARRTASHEPLRTAHPAPAAHAWREPLQAPSADPRVEIRIGAITLQVRAPEPTASAAPPAPAPRESFAPHRHYLRGW